MERQTATLIVGELHTRKYNPERTLGCDYLPLTCHLEVEDDLPLLTTRQMNAVRYALQHLVDSGWSIVDPDQYEWKEAYLRSNGGHLALYAEVGRVGDEGTLGSLYRYRLHIFVGRNGGLTAIGKKGGYKTGRDALRAALEW